MENLTPRFWRIRMKVQGWLDQSEAAWDRSEVGIWYGAWSAEDWEQAHQSHSGNEWAALRNLPEQQRLGWENYQPDMGAVRRFKQIRPEDWVIVFLPGRDEVGLARLETGVRSISNHPLNQANSDGDGQEIFKFRNILYSKNFKISELPDAYRLLSQQGRGNIHEFHGMREHVRLLAESSNSVALRDAVRAMPFDRLLDVLGASAWESVSLAYLILEHGFVPTGLSVGRTLKIFDIIGRNMTNGTRIIAQCKKNPSPVAIERGFKDAVDAHEETTLAFYFAFGGCTDKYNDGIIVIDREDILKWVKTERGSSYRSFFVVL